MDFSYLQDLGLSVVAARQASHARAELRPHGCASASAMSSPPSNPVTETERAAAHGKLKKTSSGSSWQRYASIENVGNQNFLGRVRALATVLGKDCEWVDTEKVHGANFSFETDGTNITYASRSSRLGNGADFFNANATMPRYHPYVMETFRLAREDHPGMKHLIIYGEYFGGYYPGYPAEPGMKKVQGGVAYSPGHHFYAFDVSIDGTQYLDFEDAYRILTSSGFPLVATPILRGPLEDVLSIDVEALETSIPSLLGHPALDRFRVAEGIVIRPIREQPRQAGERCILKKKSQAFWEATNQPGMALKAGMAPHMESSQEDRIVEIARGFMNENRLRAVISKSPDLLQAGQQMKLIGLFTKDVCEELDKCHSEELAALGKDQGRFKKTLLMMSKLFVEAEVLAIRADVG